MASTKKPAARKRKAWYPPSLRGSDPSSAACSCSSIASFSTMLCCNVVAVSVGDGSGSVEVDLCILISLDEVET